MNNLNIYNKSVISGWLVVHTPKKNIVQYSLKEGENFIGDERGSSKDKLDISVGGDKYVSRFHAIIHVIKLSNNEGYSYYLTDDNSNPNGKPSTNGTYINGNSQRISSNQKIILNDGDSIQVGETILRLKTIKYAKNSEEAKTQVLQMDYEKTVVILDYQANVINK